MAPSDLEQQLVKYLTDTHSIEQQALAQMRSAPRLAGSGELATLFEAHLAETEQHERLIRERLDAHEATPSTIKDLLGTLTGKGFVAFAAGQPDTPGKLVVHAVSYEHMEEAAYQLLAAVAEKAGDTETVVVSQQIGAQELAMAERLEGSFDLAAARSLHELQPDDMQAQLNKYLADAHAIEGQALQLLNKAQDIAGSPELASAYGSHRTETERHARLIEDRLAARDAGTSALKDAALRAGALNWGAFFQAQPDTPAKLAAFAYAFEHLEIGAYEMLRRIAERAHDSDTVAIAERILADERNAAARLQSLFGEALEVSLHEQGVAAH